LPTLVVRFMNNLLSINLNGAHAKNAEGDCELNLALFSREESILVDLLMTLKKLRAAMKSYTKVMVLKWAVRSQLSGYAFHRSRSTITTPQCHARENATQNESAVHGSNPERIASPVS
jgi:hypothetical protein